MELLIIKGASWEEKLVVELVTLTSCACATECFLGAECRVGCTDPLDDGSAMVAQVCAAAELALVSNPRIFLEVLLFEYI